MHYYVLYSSGGPATVQCGYEQRLRESVEGANLLIPVHGAGTEMARCHAHTTRACRSARAPEHGTGPCPHVHTRGRHAFADANADVPRRAPEGRQPRTLHSSDCPAF